MEETKTKYRAVFLDVDNTILDFDEYVKETMRSGFEKFGIGVYEERMYPVFLRINTGLWEQIERREITLKELQEVRWNRIFEALGLSFDGQVFEAYFRDCLFSSAIPVEGAAEAVEYLSGRTILCVASNGPFEQQKNRLRLAGMLPYMKHLFVSERMGAVKPSTDFFERSFRELNGSLPEGEQPILPGETLIIGDSLTSDMAGGRGFGMKTCLFLKGRPRETVKTKGIDICISRLCEVKEIL